MTSLKQSKISSVTSNNLALVQQTQSYNQLLNLRTTLLHMQYLHASLSQSLQAQHQNQQNQHKDHLIQCYNLKQQLEQLKKSNFTKLFIVKLEEFLQLQQQCNENLLAQPLINVRQANSSGYAFSESDSIEFTKQYELVPKLQKFMAYVQVKQQQIQQSLCKLYLGNKVMIDLQKTSQSINHIEQKIDQFFSRNQSTILLYNQRLDLLEKVKGEFRQYLTQVSQVIESLSPVEQNQDLKTTILHNKINTQKFEQNKTKNRSQIYQKNLKSKLISQQTSIESRISQLKQTLLSLE